MAHKYHKANILATETHTVLFQHYGGQFIKVPCYSRPPGQFSMALGKQVFSGCLCADWLTACALHYVWASGSVSAPSI